MTHDIQFLITNSLKNCCKVQKIIKNQKLKIKNVFDFCILYLSLQRF